MRSLVLLAAVTVAAGCAAKGARPTTPAKIDVACQLVSDGGTCDFTNVGGAASRCVRALVAVRSTGTVITSDELCSGRLPAAGKITVAVRFTRRPAELCGSNPSSACAVKVVESPNADAAAEAWQKEILVELDGGMSRGKGPLARGECRRLAEHIYQLRLDDELSYSTSPQERDEARRYMAEERQYIIEDWTHSCMNDMSREIAVCMMRSRKLEDGELCWDQAAP